MIFTVKSKGPSFENIDIESWGRSNGFCYKQYGPYLCGFSNLLRETSIRSLTSEDKISLRRYFYSLLIQFSERFDQLVLFPTIAKSLNWIEEGEFKNFVSSEKNRKKLNSEVKVFREAMRFFLYSFEQKFDRPFKDEKLKFNYSFPKKTSPDLYLNDSIGTVLLLSEERINLKDLIKESQEIIEEYIRIIREILFNKDSSLNELEEGINFLLYKGKNKFEEINKSKEIKEYSIETIGRLPKKLDQIIELDKNIRDGLFSEKFLDKEEETEVKRAYLLGKTLMIMRVYITMLGDKLSILSPYSSSLFYSRSLKLEEELNRAIERQCSCSHWKNKIRRSIPHNKIRKILMILYTGLSLPKNSKDEKLPWYIWDLLGQCIPCSYTKNIKEDDFSDRELRGLNQHNRGWLITITNMDLIK